MTIVKLSVIQAIIIINSEENGSHATVFRSKRIKARDTSLPCEIAELLVPLVADASLSGWGAAISHVYQVGEHARAHQFKSSASADQNNSCIFSFKMCVACRAQAFHKHSGTPVINTLNLGLQK